MAEHNELGQRGEQEAEKFLRGKGHEILARNWRSGKAEVDIISRYGKYVVFTEVKTRHTAVHGQPEESVNREKQKMLAKAADDYVYKHKVESEIRFDIVSVILYGTTVKCYHIEDAFFWIER